MKNRRVQGYWDLGPAVVPPRPSFIVMVDREDGTEWWLSRELDEEEVERVTISDTAPSGFQRGNVRRYGPYDGPWIEARIPVRLFVTSAHLGYDSPAVGAVKVQAARVFTRAGMQRTISEIYAEENFSLGDTLSVRTTDL